MQMNGRRICGPDAPTHSAADWCPGEEEQKVSVCSSLSVSSHIHFKKWFIGKIQHFTLPSARWYAWNFLNYSNQLNEVHMKHIQCHKKHPCIFTCTQNDSRLVLDLKEVSVNLLVQVFISHLWDYKWLRLINSVLRQHTALSHGHTVCYQFISHSGLRQDGVTVNCVPESRKNKRLN